MRYSYFLFTLFALSWSAEVHAQQYQPPVNDVLAKAMDYRIYQDTVITTVNWLLHSSLDRDIQTRREAEKFLVGWLNGCPQTINLNGTIAPIMNKKNSPYHIDLLTAYVGAMAVFEIQHPNNKSQDTIQLAGVDGVLTLYQYNIPLLYKDKSIRNYIRLKKNGQLSQWIHDQLK
ncbi:MAG TPA: hypothetical protein VNE41_01770 [Chitinophagaceae bacterium]|nr:hypothetical protein [Chitinophagaceae bacterium]